MNSSAPSVYLARHGETTWSVSGQYTGLTDLPLTERGERNAQRLGERLKGLKFTAVLASPLQRAWRTCELAGFSDVARPDPDLLEWNYGAYDGHTPQEILLRHPGWVLFRDGCPGGESPEDVGARADRVLRLVRDTHGDALLFSSGHILRVFAARWLGLEPAAGRYLALGAAALSVLGYDQGVSDPVIRLWNDCSHVERG
jgi:broad specificity phosphatase PhoE